MTGKWRINQSDYIVCVCDVIKQNQSEVRRPKQRRKWLLFPIVFGMLQLLISVEPTDPFQWGFQQNVAVKMMLTVSQKD